MLNYHPLHVVILYRILIEFDCGMYDGYLIGTALCLHWNDVMTAPFVQTEINLIDFNLANTFGETNNSFCTRTVLYLHRCFRASR